MLNKIAHIKLDQKKIIINDKLICTNWYELIHDVSLTNACVSNCKRKNIVIHINNNLTITKKEIIDFFSKYNLKVIKIYKNKKLIYKNTHTKKIHYFSTIIFTCLIIVNIYLNTLIVENNKIKSTFNLLNSTLTKLIIKKTDTQKSRVNKFFTKYKILNQLNCFIEKIIFKKDFVYITFVSIDKIETKTQDKRNIIPVLLTDIGGIYEIKFNY